MLGLARWAILWELLFVGGLKLLSMFVLLQDKKIWRSFLHVLYLIWIFEGF